MKKIMDGIKKICSKITHLLIRVLERIVPKSDQIWVFGAWSGKLYADNTKYFFEYMNQAHPTIKTVWITKNKSVCSKVRQAGYSCYTNRSLAGLYFVMRSGVVFETEGEWDVLNGLNPRGKKVVQLWHGVAGKAVNWKLNNGNPMFNEKTQKRFDSYYWMATSEKYIDVLHTATGASKEHFRITGYPRNDAFVSRPRNEMMEHLMAEHPGHRFVIYMPTHRNFGKENISIEAFSHVDEELRKKKIIMVYKPHFHELKNLLNQNAAFTNIILAKEEELWSDVYSYIHYFDLLISDYSSIVYDFLCAKKPIILFTYDLEHFRNEDAGLWDHYESVPAGPFCFTWDEVLENMESLLEKDTWFEKREICRSMFHPFDDGNNSQRVYEATMNWVIPS